MRIFFFEKSFCITENRLNDVADNLPAVNTSNFMLPSKKKPVCAGAQSDCSRLGLVLSISLCLLSLSSRASSS